MGTQAGVERVTSRVKQSAGALTRALWLADLARAIDEAQRLAWRLGVVEGRSEEALELYVQLESARAEVDLLRRACRDRARDELAD